MIGKIIEIQNKIFNLIDALGPAQNPMWERPSDEEIIDVLNDVLMAMPVIENSITDLYNDNDELHDAIEDCEDDLKDAQMEIDNVLDVIRKVKRLLK